MKKELTLIVAALLAAPAFAGGKKHEPVAPGIQGEQTQAQGQLQGQLQGQGQSQAAQAASSAGSQSASTGIGIGGDSTAMSGGNSLATNISSRDRALALALPSATADPGSSAPCLESRRGWVFAGNGASGRTRVNAECMALYEREQSFEQCVAIADRLMEWNQPRLAYEQLKTCGAVDGVFLDEVTADVVTRQELDEKLDRVVQTVAAK